MGVNYIAEIKHILSEARTKAYAVINTTMVEAYWQIGKRIVEEEQKGKARAEYGKEIVENLAKELSQEFGNGFSRRSIFQYRQFYLLFPPVIVRTAFAQSPMKEISLKTNKGMNQLHSLIRLYKSKNSSNFPHPIFKSSNFQIT
ncbi:DUF1016 N-terminal domain-containing protein [Pinibacter aurantiacus]|uniref:YhcG N-terminal domain-containing protein n=1 Tax=Pinibacter aurantiacus TaxID=2851599 RepID=A0A9E2S858_9BACT|nr:DUF1016 N-terminal domain-containing protein [Pinibacter aurantiacus]MBV4356474.1 hypothetical protein [Pinibacter aurantiacus]